MEIDFTLRDIINKIKAHVLEKHGYTLTDEQIVDCVNSQSKGLKFALQNKMSAKLTHLGKFVIKSGREESVEAHREAKELGLTGESRKIFLEQKKQEWKEENARMEEERLLEEREEQEKINKILKRVTPSIPDNHGTI